MTLPKSILTLAFLISSYCFAQSGVKNFIGQPFIEVTGTMETEIIPNEIYLNIILNENDKNGKISIEIQENRMISILRSLQIDIDEQFSILDFNGYYKRKFLSDNKVTKTKRYQLIVDSGECLGNVYEALDKIDISNISITKTSHSDIEKIRRETKLKALKIAKEKANDYANAVEQTIGKAIFIREQTLDLNVLSGSSNGIHVRGYSQNYQAESIKAKIQDLNLQPILISEAIHAKFILI